MRPCTNGVKGQVVGQSHGSITWEGGFKQVGGGGIDRNTPNNQHKAEQNKTGADRAMVLHLHF
jgi:hypothetical protein